MQHTNNYVNSIWRVLKSVIAAFFGVQSESNRINDFEHPENPALYVIISVILVSLMISLVFTVILWITS